MSDKRVLGRAVCRSCGAEIRWVIGDPDGGNNAYVHVQTNERVCGTVAEPIYE